MDSIILFNRFDSKILFIAWKMVSVIFCSVISIVNGGICLKLKTMKVGCRICLITLNHDSGDEVIGILYRRFYWHWKKGPHRQT